MISPTPRADVPSPVSAAARSICQGKLSRYLALACLALAAAWPAAADLIDYDYDPQALPKPILDDRPEWIELYYRAWELAADNMQFATPASGFAAEYMDEALDEKKVWQWDALFVAMFAKYSNGELPIMTGVDNFYLKQRSDGYICRELSEVDGTDIYPNEDQPWPVSNPNPPLYSWAEWDYYRVTGDASRLTRSIVSNRKDEPPQAKTLLRRMVDYHYWIKNNIRHADGHYRSDYWANGMDDSPRNDITMAGAWMDLAAQQALSALYLARLAEALGDAALQREMMDEHRQHRALIDNAYWHEADKLYYDLDADRQVHKSKTVATFWPLAAEVASRNQAEHLTRHLMDPNTFWRPLLVPSLAADQQGYSKTGEYWRGASWPPTTYQTVRGLAAYGYRNLARTVAENYIDGLYKLYERSGTIWENTAPEVVAPSFDSTPHFVGWGGLGPIAMLLEHVLGIDLNAHANRVVWHMAQTSRHGVENLDFAGGTIARMVSAPRASANAPAQVTIQTTVPFELEVRIGDASHVRAISAGAPATYRFGADNAPPVARANGPYRMTPDQPVTFDSTGSTDADGSLTAYSWDFGDGTVSDAANPIHSYAEPGSYRVRLTVTDDDGATRYVDTFASSAKPKPIVAFYANHTRIEQGSSVRFRDSSAHAPTRWRWKFPGGQPATSDRPDPVVTYAKEGKYAVSLTVGNAYGEAQTTYSGYMDVTGDMPTDYCLARPIYTSSAYSSYISRFAIDTLAHATDSDGYSLRQTDAQWTSGTSATLEMELKLVQPVDDYPAQVRAWVDWNENRLFEPDERVLDQATQLSDQPIRMTHSLVVPSAASGEKRLRVKVNYDRGEEFDFGPCYTFLRGEVEDYVVTLEGSPSATQAGQ